MSITRTKELFMEQRIWEDRLELLPLEEEFIYHNHVQNDKGRARVILRASSKKNRGK